MDTYSNKNELSEAKDDIYLLSLANERLRGLNKKLEADMSIASKLIAELRDRIAALENANRWIPIEERLPKDGQHFLGHGRCGVDFPTVHKLIVCDGKFFLPFSIEVKITHWREFPEPPKG